MEITPQTRVHDYRNEQNYNSPHVMESVFGVRESFSCGIWNLGNVCLWNPESWALKFGIQPDEAGIQNPSSTEKDLDSSNKNTVPRR